MIRICGCIILSDRIILGAVDDESLEVLRAIIRRNSVIVGRGEINAEIHAPVAEIPDDRVLTAGKEPDSHIAPGTIVIGHSIVPG